jgi:hypothetical protein
MGNLYIELKQQLAEIVAFEMDIGDLNIGSAPVLYLT